MTAGSPARLLVRFTWPLIVGQSVQILYGYTDMLIVGRTLGMNALAGVGSTMSVIHLIIGFCMGVANAVGILIAQRYGAQDGHGMRRTFALGLCVCLCIGCIAALIAVPMTPHILHWMRTPPEIFGDARRYMRVMLGAAPATILGILLPVVLRAVGDSRSPMLYQMVSVALNIALDLVFILAFGWGVIGAAASTVLAQALPCALCVVLICRKYPLLRLTRAHFHWSMRRAREILALGVPMGLQQSIVGVGNLFVQSVINGLGAVAVAAVTVAQRIREINMMPLFCLGISVSTYAAQNAGAGRIDRVRSGVRAACTLAVGCGVAMAVLNILTGHWLAGLLLPDAPEATALAHQYLIWVGCCLFLLGLMLVFRNVLQGMGHRQAPLLSSAAELAASILCAFVLVPFYGFTGVNLANPLAWLLSGAPLFLAYARWAAQNARGVERRPAF